MIAVGVLGVAPARAGIAEVHETGHDVHVRVDASGHAIVEHAITVRVANGTFHGFDLEGLEKDAAVEGDLVATTDDARPIVAHASASDVPGKGRIARIDVADAKGLKRGVYEFRVRYAVDLVEDREITRDGALFRVSWTSPGPVEGLDGARVVFELPPAETEPRAVRIDGIADDAIDSPALENGILSTLRRGPERDEVEIVRPHISRGEAVTWTVRADPKAFAGITAPELRPPPPPLPPPAPPRHGLRAAALVVVGLLFAALVAAKSSAVERATARAKLAPRPALPIASRWRAIVAGVALASGAALQGAGMSAAGAAAIAIAMVAAAHLAPKMKPAPRGPGSWLTLRPDEAFARVACSDPLDATTALGVAAIGAMTSILVMLASILARVGPEAPYLVALDALALVPIFFTGTRRQLPPDPSRAPAPMLRALAAKLRKESWLRASPWVRVPTGATEPDELRLLLLPRAAMPGLAGIEVGVAWRPAGGGFWAAPEVLVRVQDATAAAARLTALAPFACPVTGRRPEERVARLVPAIPSVRGILDILIPLARELVDRRAAPTAAAPWSGEERRARPKPLDEGSLAA